MKSIQELNKVYETDYIEFFKNEELWEQIVAKKKLNLDKKQEKNGDYQIILDNGTIIEKNEFRNKQFEVPWFLKYIPKFRKD